jgi:hypothetical protein
MVFSLPVMVHVVAPETATPADPMGLQYLERFYSKAV